MSSDPDVGGPFYVIVSRQYHHTPDGIGPFVTFGAAKAFYDKLYEDNPDHPIFGDEVGIHRVAPMEGLRR